MDIQLSCECGKSVTVTESKAESKVPCQCGRMVQVPTYFELRKLAGVPLVVHPEILIQRLLAAGKLPEERECLVCGIQTAEVVRCWLDCERALVRPGGSFFHPANFFLLLLGAFVIERREHEQLGSDKQFYLPLRVCSRCRNVLHDDAVIKATLARVRAYRALLEKYPNAHPQIVQD